MTDSLETFQISPEAAAYYEANFVPLLFGKWAPHLVAAAGIRPGDSVLDVACGTGIVARTAADVVGDAGRVAGTDLNEAMLTVARGIRPDLEWRQADAATQPFPDGSFDAVLCQSALMFFPDQPAALREMARVAGPDGTVAVQVWGTLDSSPGFARFTEIAARHAGDDAVPLLTTYFSLGDLDRLAALAAAAGLEVTATVTRTGVLSYASVEEFMAVEVGSTPLRDRLSDEVQGRILAEARDALASFHTPAGRLEIPLDGHLVTARRRR